MKESAVSADIEMGIELALNDLHAARLIRSPGQFRKDVPAIIGLSC